MEIRYYDGKKLDCIKCFSPGEEEDFNKWIDFEKKIGNSVVMVNNEVYKCFYKAQLPCWCFAWVRLPRRHFSDKSVCAGCEGSVYFRYFDE